MKFDLHVHTYYSDGRFSPEDLIDLAFKRKLRGIAITDHDSILAIEPAMEYSKKYKDFIIIPGIEFSCIYNDEEVHILGYFIDYKHDKIIETTSFLKKARKKRVYDIIKLLDNEGIKIEYKDIKRMSGTGFMGRVPIAKALIEKAYVSNIDEAFTKYLARGKSAYVQKESLTIEKTLELIEESGGISILAHPGLLKDESIIKYCISRGIKGLECIHSKHTKKQVELFRSIVKNENLICTAGSDCHGELIDGELLLGKYSINIEMIPEFKERI